MLVQEPTPDQHADVMASKRARQVQRLDEEAERPVVLLAVHEDRQAGRLRDGAEHLRGDH